MPIICLIILLTFFSSGVFAEPPKYSEPSNKVCTKENNLIEGNKKSGEFACYAAQGFIGVRPAHTFACYQGSIYNNGQGVLNYSFSLGCEIDYAGCDSKKAIAIRVLTPSIPSDLYELKTTMNLDEPTIIGLRRVWRYECK